MKFYLCAILIIASVLKVVAQNGDSSIKYIWKNETMHIDAVVEISNLQKNKSASSIYFLKNVDTVYNSATDSLFQTFTNSSFLNCPVIKISFYNSDDSIPDKKIKLYSDAFIKFILPDLQKKYRQLNSNNIIVSGINDFSLVALFIATNNPYKINKTALFFNDDGDFSKFNMFNLEGLKHLKGKLFMYVNHQNYNDVFTDSLAANLALASSTVLYKYDHYGNLLPFNIFIEAYKWLMTDGNNYIIENTD